MQSSSSFFFLKLVLTRIYVHFNSPRPSGYIYLILCRMFLTVGSHRPTRTFVQVNNGYISARTRVFSCCFSGEFCFAKVNYFFSLFIFFISILLYFRSFFTFALILDFSDKLAKSEFGSLNCSSSSFLVKPKISFEYVVCMLLDMVFLFLY